MNMEAVLKAAQWDPQKTGSAITPGSGPSVLLVEKALQAKGLLAASYVDGHYGTSTVTAYTVAETTRIHRTRRQRHSRRGVAEEAGDRSVHGRVRGPAGCAGRLRRTDGRRPHLGHAHRGGVDPRGAAALDQGSYSTSDPTSAGTHAGGGVVDVNVDGWSAAHRRTVAGVLRSVGFAAWVRSPTEGDWPWHIHAVAISDPDLAPEAQAQVGDYYLGATA